MENDANENAMFKLLQNAVQEAAHEAADPEILLRFIYHAPKPGQKEKYEMIRETALILANCIMANCPDSRERSLAITHLEDVVYCANASIARREK